MIEKDHRFDIFGITALPFRGTPEKFYLNQSRKELAKRLELFLQARGFAVLCGPSGAGKSSFLNWFCGTLNSKTHQLIYIPFATLNDSDMLRAICREMNIPAAMTRSKMLKSIQNTVNDMQPVNPLLIFDEAQKLAPDTLEMIRLMSNFGFDGKNNLSVIFAGTPELLQRFRLRILEPLCQRISLFGKIEALSRNETCDYIRNAFRAVGAEHDLIDESALNLIHDLSAGIPRLINSVTGAALEAAAEQQSQLIQTDHVRSAQQRVLLPESEVKYA